jgi:hypothetical protein
MGLWVMEASGEGGTAAEEGGWLGLALALASEVGRKEHEQEQEHLSRRCVGWGGNSDLVVIVSRRMRVGMVRPAPESAGAGS